MARHQAGEGGFVGIKFRAAHLIGANRTGADLHGTDLRGAALAYARLAESKQRR